MNDVAAYEYGIKLSTRGAERFRGT
jgi:hypothetical protein